MWFQTGAVKHGRKAASQLARIAGIWQEAGVDSARSGVIAGVESRRQAGARVPEAVKRRRSLKDRDIALWNGLCCLVTGDAIIQQIEEFRCPRGILFAERRNRGYTIYDAGSGAPVARLRLTTREGRFEVLYWSLWKERWAPTGPFGRTVLSISEALQFISCEDIFWAMT
jgi:hypothetical protein